MSGEYLKSGMCHELKFVNKKSITYRQASLTTWVILAENEIHLGQSSSSRHLVPNLFPDTRHLTPDTYLFDTYLFREESMRKKVTVIGAGNVGATLAHRIVDKQLADVVVIDILEGVPQGKCLDLLEAGPIEGYDVKVKGTNDYKDTANSDIVVMTAGFPRKPGMSRDDLLKANYEVVKTAIEQAAKHSPNAILIVVTNPLDAMVQTAFRVSGFPKNRVIGMAGILDSARYRTFLAEALNVSVQDVEGLVLGGHGDTMVPVPSYTTVAGVPVSQLMPKEQLDKIIDRTRKGGGEIVALLKTGSAFYAPSAAVVQMIDAIFNDRKKILPCAAYLEGEYGINGLFVGVPVKLGARGIEEIVQIKLTPEEQAALEKSAAAVKELVEIIGV